MDEPRAQAAPQAAVAPTSAPAASMRLGTRTTTPRRPASGRGARLTGGTGGAGHAPKPAAGPALHDQHERKGSHGDAPDARSSAHQRLPRRSRRSHPILARPDATSATAGTGPAGRSVGGGTVTWTWESPLGPHTTGQGNTKPETTRVIEFDPSRPHPARVYQAWLGGKDTFGPDRDLAAKVTEIAPWVVASARGNRAFLTRVVTYLAKAGINQFLDVGSGLPAAGNVHEIAQGINPDARVVYVDHDEIVLEPELIVRASAPAAEEA